MHGRILNKFTATLLCLYVANNTSPRVQQHQQHLLVNLMNENAIPKPSDDNEDSEGEGGKPQPTNDDEDNDVLYVNNQGQCRRLPRKYAPMMANPLCRMAGSTLVQVDLPHLLRNRTHFPSMYSKTFSTWQGWTSAQITAHKSHAPHIMTLVPFCHSKQMLFNPRKRQPKTTMHSRQLLQNKIIRGLQKC